MTGVGPSFRRGAGTLGVGILWGNSADSSEPASKKGAGVAGMERVGAAEC